MAAASALVFVVPALTTAVRAAPVWAPASTATVHPGVMTFTNGGQCTANFVFTGSAGVYLGQSAHCASTALLTETNGCDAGSLPIGTPVQVQGAAHPGVLAYSSWLTMQSAGETDANACEYNDFALVKLDSRDVAKVNPSVPIWGGPTSLGTSTAPLSTVYSYGNSSLRLGVPLLSPKTGISLGDTAGGWTRTVYTVTPGIPGDSGSAFLNSTGQAVGTLSTIALLPLPGSNGVSDLAKALAYARSHGGPDVSLVRGTQPFTGTLGILGILG